MVMSNTWRLMSGKLGREGKANRVRAGSQREWQRMYLSRSQIINRDSVVWIERRKETAEWGERRTRAGEREGNGWGGEGSLRTGGETEGVRWRSDRRADG